MNFKNTFQRQNNQSLRILHTDQDVQQVISQHVLSWLPKSLTEYVVICVGTDRSTGDALGPLTGTMLTERRPKHLAIYGTLHEPVHATNLTDYMKQININHRNPFIIAIDACLGKSTSIGYLIANKSPLKPGAAFNKPLPELGDIHMTGVVNASGPYDYTVLQNTRLSFVKDMASQIVSILNSIDEQLTRRRAVPAIVYPPSIQQASISNDSTTRIRF